MSKKEQNDELKKQKEYYELELNKRDKQIEELKRDNTILLRTALKQAEKKLVVKELEKAKKEKEKR